MESRRVIRTLEQRLTEIEAPQGFVAETSAASTLLSASYFGYPLSTTHIVSGGILGVGIGKRFAEVRWGLAGQMVVAWVLTLPAAALVAGGIYEIAAHLGERHRRLAGHCRRGGGRRDRAVRIHPAPRHGLGGRRRMTLASVIDFAALWKILVVVVGVGVGVTALFGQGVVSLERLEQARDEHVTAGVPTNGFVVGLAGLVCIAAFVLGFIAMTHKLSRDPTPNMRSLADR